MVIDDSSKEYIHVVAAVIWHPFKESTFLISLRKKGTHLADLWELPGGKLEVDESPAQGLRRELNEELNITMINFTPLMQVKHQYDDRNILLDVWSVTSYKGLVHGRENQQIRWININDISSYEFPEADIPVLKSIGNNAKA